MTRVGIKSRQIHKGDQASFNLVTGAKALVLVALLAMLASCTTNPATGKSQLATLSSVEDDAKIGAQAHPKIVAAYGGVYDDPRVGQYVARVTQRIVHGTSQPSQPYRVTVLDSSVVNAFALPGGYVYVTRGLLALANDEAELAGVLGHEIGHVIARHGAQRQTAAFGASVIGAVLGAVVGNSAVSQAVGLGGQGVIASYSRDQEYQADMLGVRYLAAAGYDPYAEADFLAAMGENSKIEAQVSGQGGEPQANWLASHPATPERVAAARREAADSQMTRGQGERNRAAFLNAVDGLIYGDSPAQGFIRGQSFIHTVARFRFDAPAGYHIVNGADTVLVTGPNKVIAKFDAATKSANVPIGTYLTNVWAANVAMSPVNLFTVHGLAAASATTRIGDYDARLVAIAAPSGKVYRFMMGAPRGTYPRFAGALDALVQSFRLISAEAAASVKPLRVHVVTVRAGDNLASLGARMDFATYRVDRFRALNGLAANAILRPGEKVKLIWP